MFKLICPKCYSTSIHIRPGYQVYREGDILMTPDYGEIHFCDDCGYHGLNVIEGNDILLKFLKERPFGKGEKKDAKEEKLELHEMRNKAWYEPRKKMQEDNFTSVLGFNIKMPSPGHHSKIIEG